MRTKLFIFTVIAFGALTVGLSAAVNRAHGDAGRVDAKQSGPRGDRHASEISGRIHAAQLLPPTHHRQESAEKLAGNTLSSFSQIHEFDQPGSIKPATAEKEHLLLSVAVDHRQHPDWILSGAATSKSCGLFRDKIVTAASIGGMAMESDRHSAAVIDGTEMKPRH